MRQKEWDNIDLSEYIKTFSDQTRETIIKQLFESELLKKALGSSNGKVLFRSAVDMIQANTAKIIDLCVNPKNEFDLSMIKECAAQIHVTHSLLMEWARVLATGEAHEKAITKTK